MTALEEQIEHTSLVTGAFLALETRKRNEEPFYPFQAKKNEQDRSWGTIWAQNFGHGRIPRSGSKEKERDTFLLLPVRGKRP
jgi:hypothetical protein